MSGWGREEAEGTAATREQCAEAEAAFSAYLDGALDGHTMTRVAAHLETCAPCATEFSTWRSVQVALGAMGPAQVPSALQAQLRDALAAEIDRGSFRSPLRRFADLWRVTLAPACLRLSAGLAAALLLIGGAAGFLGSTSAVQANDAHMTDFHPPQYLYSPVPPQPIHGANGFVAVLVDAKVDARGRVYDYHMVAGPDDAATRARVEANLLGSLFRPATVFGVPVPSHAMVTYTTVSVHG